LFGDGELFIIEEENKMSKLIKRVSIAVTALLAVGTAQAGLILSESFDYNTTYKLMNIGSGTGWGTNLWTSADGCRIATNPPASLAYPSGTSLVASGTRLSGIVGGTISDRLMGSVISTADTYYMSFLAKKNAAGSFYIETMNATQARFGVQVMTNGVVNMLNASGQWVGILTAGAFANDTTYMVLAKTTSTNTSVALYSAGVPMNESNVTWNSLSRGITGIVQDRVRICTSTATPQLDEFRFGNTFESVTAIPVLPGYVDEDFSAGQGAWVTRAQAGYAVFNGSTFLIRAWDGGGNPGAAYLAFTPTALQTGETLRLSADIKVSDLTGLGYSVRMGLGYANPIMTTDVAGVNATLSGYFLQLPTQGDTGWNPLVYKVTDSSGGSGVNFFGTTSQSIGFPMSAEKVSNLAMTPVLFEITRTNNNLLFSTTINGNKSTTVTENNATNFQFNTVGLAYGYAGAAIATYDNVKVEFISSSTSPVVNPAGFIFSIRAKPNDLWSNLATAAELADVRGITAEFDDSGPSRVLRLDVVEPTPSLGQAWVAVPVPEDGWNLNRAASVQATIKNSGVGSVETMLWVVGSNGWSAVGSFATLATNETRTFSCNLREKYPDGTPKIDPTQLKQVQIMVSGANVATALEITGLVATGTAAEWVRPTGRMDVPDMAVASPAAGRRVRYQLAGDAGSEIYCVLYLPSDWQAGRSYPVIAEYPGNVFYGAACYSTGRPEQCAMGYGMTEGQGAIWVSLPFVNRSIGEIVENGFGNADDTVNYAIDVINDICTNFGGDTNNLVLSGFSRGAIACGYIGLRNDRIAALWKGFSACQHYDGVAWAQSNMAGAVERAPRFIGRAIFQTDNSQTAYQPVVDATNPSVVWTWATSGLGFHSTAMFLDNRPSTLQVRQWFRDLTATP
jgi:hypothetical protein